MVQAWGLFLREGCSTGALGSEQGWIGGGCLAVGFLSLIVSPLGSQAPLKLVPVRRSLPPKVVWCLALAVNAFTALGVNDSAFGAVVEPPVLDPISIQVYGVHSRPSSLAPTTTTVVSPAFMSAMHLLFFYFVSLSLWYFAARSM
ncbi:hypothetical protein V6N13_076887 [Hibiscus sabdariffa]